MEEFFTWEYLATFAGASAAVTLITQVIKRYVSIDPKWIALAASLVIEAGIQFLYLRDFTVSGIFLAVVNVFVVLAAAVGVFETVVKPVQNLTQQKVTDTTEGE
ncbi:hypothetical protein [Feifania hominis]|uniref:Uncharacterized protein n=1 Tax=Feifania hominis TaxID=2763660 RepID=A0A926DEQ6_9FIRM|nr:hypothetical protein [Feifania hominis]MBC8537263.1 hypothetical protein [Feifania hominis]